MLEMTRRECCLRVTEEFGAGSDEMTRNRGEERARK